MKWWVKAAAARALAAVPFGEQLHYAAQRFVTRTLPPDESAIAARLASARTHLQEFGAATGRDVAGQTFFEFGAGWDLAIPLLYCAAGVSRQVLVDLRPLARRWLVAHTIEVIRRLEGETDANRAPAVDVSRLPPEDQLRAEPLAGYLRAVGIEYRAPADARATGLPNGSVDCVTSTATLEHIPVDTITAIMREMYRILKPRGVFSNDIDLSDHFRPTFRTSRP